MTETMELTIDQDDEMEVKMLWNLINTGWSVVKAAYSAKKRQFKIKLSDALWPAVTISCSGCGVRMPPAYLSFRPFPSDIHLCIVCNR